MMSRSNTNNMWGGKIPAEEDLALDMFPPFALRGLMFGKRAEPANRAMVLEGDELLCSASDEWAGVALNGMASSEYLSWEDGRACALVDQPFRYL